MSMRDSSVRRKIDLAIIAYLSVCLGIAFSIVLPSLQPFILSQPSDSPSGLNGSPTMYSLVVAIFSVGEFFGAILLAGFDRKVSIATLFRVSSFIGLIGSAIYALSSHVAMAIVGRFLTGLWAGALNALIRAYITQSTNRDNISQLMVIVAFFITMSMTVGPVFGGLFSQTAAGDGMFRFDAYRGPGWILSVLCCIAILVLFFFKETPDFHQSEGKQLIQRDCDIEPEKNSLWVTNGASSWAILLTLATFFIFSLGWSIVETMATPILRDSYGMNVAQTSNIFLIAGAANLATFIALFLIKKFTSRMNDRFQCIVALVCCIASSIILMDWQSLSFDECNAWSCNSSSAFCNQSSTICEMQPLCVWNQNGLYGVCADCLPLCQNPSLLLNIVQMYVGFIFMNIGFPAGRVGAGAFYSQILQGTKSGFMQGIIVASGSAARITAPLIAVVLYEAVTRHTYVLMSCLLAIFLACFCAQIAFYKKLGDQIGVNVKQSQNYEVH